MFQLHPKNTKSESTPSCFNPKQINCPWQRFTSFDIYLCLLLKTISGMHNKQLGFTATIADFFTLNYWLRDFPLPAVANRFEQASTKSKRCYCLTKSTIVTEVAPSLLEVSVKNGTSNTHKLNILHPLTML